MCLMLPYKAVVHWRRGRGCIESQRKYQLEHPRRSSMNLQWIAIPAIFCLSACAAQTPPTKDKLAGTAWQLVSIQSMDDSQGTTSIANPANFTLHFNPDGRAVLKLDCNRATGSYETKPGIDGHTGSLTFGPIASTRALCPPPNIDQRIARNLQHVRSYLIKEGKLYLSLMADGGIYAWERHHE